MRSIRAPGAMKEKDAIEIEYEIAIQAATRKGECDKAYELSIGLKQYRQFYKGV